MSNKIAFIGAGNMASALINGLLTDGYPANDIIASDQLAEKEKTWPALAYTLLMTTARQFLEPMLSFWPSNPRFYRQSARKSGRLLNKTIR